MSADWTGRYEVLDIVACNTAMTCDCHVALSPCASARERRRFLVAVRVFVVVVVIGVVAGVIVVVAIVVVGVIVVACIGVVVVVVALILVLLPPRSVPDEVDVAVVDRCK